MTDSTPQLDLETLDPERREIITLLRRHRGFLLQTVEGLTREQATNRPTVSDLTLAGIIKHVASVQAGWSGFIKHGAPAMSLDLADPAVVAGIEAHWHLADDETLESVIEHFRSVADEVDQTIAEAPDLNAMQELAPAPWFPAGESWSTRRVAMHLLAEISQHSGHADIIRETIDGAKTMG